MSSVLQLVTKTKCVFPFKKRLTLFEMQSDKQRDRDTEKNVFNLLANSLINHKCWSWGRAKPGALIST